MSTTITPFLNHSRVCFFTNNESSPPQPNTNLQNGSSNNPTLKVTVEPQDRKPKGAQTPIGESAMMN
jgi:hypothetical protein